MHSVRVVNVSALLFVVTPCLHDLTLLSLGRPFCRVSSVGPGYNHVTSKQQPSPFSGLLFEDKDSPDAPESQGRSGLAMGGRAAPWVPVILSPKALAFPIGPRRPHVSRRSSLQARPQDGGGTGPLCTWQPERGLAEDGVNTVIFSPF